MDKVEGWNEEKWVGSKFSACMWLYTEAVLCDRRGPTQEELRRILVIIRESVSRVCEDALWVTELNVLLKESVKTTPQKTRFRSVNNYKELQGIHIQVKKWIRGNTDEDWINDAKQNDKHNNIFNVDANLKHVQTHENNTWRLVSALFLFVSSIVSL